MQQTISIFLDSRFIPPNRFIPPKLHYFTRKILHSTAAIYREGQESTRAWRLKVTSKKSRRSDPRVCNEGARIIRGMRWNFFSSGWLASRVTFRTGKWYRLKIRERNGSGGEGTTGNTESTRVPERFRCDFTCQRERSNSPGLFGRGIILGRNTIIDTRASVSLNAREKNQPPSSLTDFCCNETFRDEEFPVFLNYANEPSKSSEFINQFHLLSNLIAESISN